jgi:hypothetical protein
MPRARGSRRPLRPLVSVLALLLPLSWGCQVPGGSSGLSSSDEEKIQAVNRLDQERRELERMQEEGTQNR